MLTVVWVNPVYCCLTQKDERRCVLHGTDGWMKILPWWPAHSQKSECAFGRSLWISVSLENVIEA